MPNNIVPPNPETAPPNLATVNLKAERSAEYAAFLKYVSTKSGVISYAQLSVLYPAICQGAMEWLLQEKKSVDLGFMLLHPTPHRANWKQAMIAMFPQLGPSILGKARVVREAILTSSGFETKMLSGELLAVGSEKYVMWGIEPELKRSWWKAMYRYEMSKFSQLGSIGYATYIAKAIVGLRAKLVRTYIAFLRQVSFPCARIQHSRVYSRGFIVPFVPKGNVRPATDKDIPVNLVVPRDPAEIVTPTLASVVSADAGLPSVPPVSSDPEDLRVPRRTNVPNFGR